MLDKYKILRTAEKFVLDRKFSQAVVEYRKLLEEDPDEPTLLNTVGDLLVRQQQPEQALTCFRQVANIYLTGGFAVKALAMYRKILQVAPDDLRAREIIAELYEKQGLTYEAVRELKALVDIQEAAGRDDLALGLLERLSGLVPDDPVIWRRRAGLFAKREKSDLARQHYLEAIRLYGAQGQFPEVLGTVEEALSHNDEDQVVLSEAIEVASRARKLPEVQSYLRNRIQKTGKEHPYRMFIGLVHERMGEPEKAGEIYKELYGQGVSDPRVSQGLMRTGQAVEFGAQPVEAAGAESEESEQFDLDLDAPPSAVPAFEPFEIDLGEGGETSGAFALDPDPPREEQEPAAVWQVPLDGGSEIKETGTGSGLFALEPAPWSNDGAGASPAAEAFGEAPLHDDLFQPEQVESKEFEDESLRVGEPEITSLEEALEEVDFYLKLGFREDGKQLLEKLLVQFPGEDRVLRRARKVMMTVPEGGTAEKPARALGGDFDEEIESALGGLFDGVEEDYDGADVLRYEVASRPNRDDNSPEVHYNLGLAYKEMGLVDDAVQEFLKSSEMLKESPNSPQMILCCSMLANSYLQMGDSREAARWARQGLRIPDKKDFERKALEYDLGCALENLGQTSEAMDVFKGIMNRDEGYRDVARRADQLRMQVNDQ